MLKNMKVTFLSSISNNIVWNWLGRPQQHVSSSLLLAFFLFSSENVACLLFLSQGGHHRDTINWGKGTFYDCFSVSVFCTVHRVRGRRRGKGS